MLSQYNLRGAIHVCVVKRIPLALAFAFLLFAFPAFAAETRGVKHTTLIKESVTGRYLALLIGNNDYRHWPKLKTAVRGCPAPCSTLKTQVK